jgi:hypothetical protein
MKQSLQSIVNNQATAMGKLMEGCLELIKVVPAKPGWNSHITGNQVTLKGLEHRLLSIKLMRRGEHKRYPIASVVSDLGEYVK